MGPATEDAIIEAGRRQTLKADLRQLDRQISPMSISNPATVRCAISAFHLPLAECPLSTQSLETSDTKRTLELGWIAFMWYTEAIARRSHL